jgi:hypothetical protein
MRPSDLESSEYFADKKPVEAPRSPILWLLKAFLDHLYAD